MGECLSADSADTPRCAAAKLLEELYTALFITALPWRFYHSPDRVRKEHTETEIERQRSRQTDSQTDRHKYRQTETRKEVQ